MKQNAIFHKWKQKNPTCYFQRFNHMHQNWWHTVTSRDNFRINPWTVIFTSMYFMITIPTQFWFRQSQTGRRGQLRKPGRHSLINWTPTDTSTIILFWIMKFWQIYARLFPNTTLHMNVCFQKYIVVTLLREQNKHLKIIFGWNSYMQQTLPNSQMG